MAEVRRGNVILTVSNEEIDKYMAKGYSLVDPKTGAVIKQSVPTELSELQKAYSEHVETIKALNAEIAILRKENQSLKAGANAPVNKGNGDDDWSNWGEEEDEKPKKKKRRNADE